MSTDRSTPSGPRVWKFTLTAPSITGRVFIDMPAVVEPLSVGMQGDAMVVWALVDPDAEYDRAVEENHGPRRFVVVNTGDPVKVPEGARFLGSVTSRSGIVWHVWDGDTETTA